MKIARKLVLTMALPMAFMTVLATPSLMPAAHAADKADAKADAKTDAKKKPAAAADLVTLSGKLMCAKCSLKETTECQNVLKVSAAGKDTKYYLDNNDVAKSHHGAVCGGSESATVTGTVSEKAGKKTIAPVEIKLGA